MRPAAKWSLTAVSLALLLGGGFYALRLGTRPAAPGPAAEEAVPVTALALTRRPFVLEGSYAARLEAVRDVTVTARAGGIVEEDLVSEGDRVRKGQVLYRLDDDAYLYAARQAEAALDLARENLRKMQSVSRPELLRRLEALAEESETALRKAESDASRFEELYRQGAVPLGQKENVDLALASARSRAKVARENLEEARRGAREEDLAAAEAGVKQAEAALMLARETLEHASVTSPMDGIVAAKHIFAGDTVRPGDRAAGIVDISSFRISVGVSSADVVHFRRGDELEVEAPPGGPPRRALVADVGVKADEKTGSFPVILEMGNGGAGDRPLRAGMDVTVRFVKARADDAIVVPSSSLVAQKDSVRAFVVEDGRARSRELQTGPSSGSETVVTGGLEEGELLVVVGQQSLRHGDLVELTVEE